MYHENRMIIGRNTVTPVTGLPGFEFTGYETEQAPPDGLDAKILELRRKAPYASLAEIAKWAGTHKMKVKRVLDKYPLQVEENTAPAKTSAPVARTDSGLRITGTPPTSENPALSKNPVNLSPTVEPREDAFARGSGKSTAGHYHHPAHKEDNRTLEEKLAALAAAMEPAEEEETLTFSQRFKKQVAQKNIERRRRR